MEKSRHDERGEWNHWNRTRHRQALKAPHKTYQGVHIIQLHRSKLQQYSRITIIIKLWCINTDYMKGSEKHPMFGISSQFCQKPEKSVLTNLKSKLQILESWQIPQLDSSHQSKLREQYFLTKQNFHLSVWFAGLRTIGPWKMILEEHLCVWCPVNVMLQAYDPHEGKDNERRLTGTSETSSIHDFSAGVIKC